MCKQILTDLMNDVLSDLRHLIDLEPHTDDRIDHDQKCVDHKPDDPVHILLWNITVHLKLYKLRDQHCQCRRTQHQQHDNKHFAKVRLHISAQSFQLFYVKVVF